MLAGFLFGHTRACRKAPLPMQGNGYLSRGPALAPTPDGHYGPSPHKRSRQGRLTQASAPAAGGSGIPKCTGARERECWGFLWKSSAVCSLRPALASPRPPALKLPMPVSPNELTVSLRSQLLTFWLICGRKDVSCQTYPPNTGAPPCWEPRQTQKPGWGAGDTHTPLGNPAKKTPSPF